MNGFAVGSAGLLDEEFTRSFENGDYPNEKFHHADHVRLAWIYVRRFGLEEAEERIAAAIRRFAAGLGHEEKYHHTLTKAWVRLVYAAWCHTPDTPDFDGFIGANQWLADRNALRAFYSEELLSSDTARRDWMEPDVRPLPAP